MKRKKSRKASTIKTLTKRQSDFLAAVRSTFANGGVRNIAQACRVARVHHSSHYRRWLGQERYREAWAMLDDEYQASIRDSVRAETERRGIEGWDELVTEEDHTVNPVTGEMVPTRTRTRTVHRFSDTMLALRNNQLFGDARRVELSGPGGGPVQAEMTARFGAVLDAIKKAKRETL